MTVYEELEAAIGEKKLLSILGKVAKLRRLGVDVEKELDRELDRLKGVHHEKANS